MSRDRPQVVEDHTKFMRWRPALCRPAQGILSHNRFHALSEPQHEVFRIFRSYPDFSCNVSPKMSNRTRRSVAECHVSSASFAPLPVVSVVGSGGVGRIFDYSLPSLNPSSSVFNSPTSQSSPLVASGCRLHSDYVSSVPSSVIVQPSMHCSARSDCVSSRPSSVIVQPVVQCPIRSACVSSTPSSVIVQPSLQRSVLSDCVSSMPSSVIVQPSMQCSSRSDCVSSMQSSVIVQPSMQCSPPPHTHPPPSPLVTVLASMQEFLLRTGWQRFSVAQTCARCFHCCISRSLPRAHRLIACMGEDARSDCVS